jgi:hypothetical protein
VCDHGRKREAVPWRGRDRNPAAPRWRRQGDKRRWVSPIRGIGELDRLRKFKGGKAMVVLAPDWAERGPGREC